MDESIFEKMDQKDGPVEVTPIACKKRRTDVRNAVVDESKNGTACLATDNPSRTLSWKKITGENLDCDYIRLYSKSEADDIFCACERNLTYNTGQLAKVQVFGKWFDIPRKQVAHGNEGFTYTFSGTRMAVTTWESTRMMKKTL